MVRTITPFMPRGQLQSMAMAGFALAVLLTLLLAGYTYVVSEEENQATTWVDHTRQVLLAINQVRGTLNDLDSSMRSFVLSGNEADLAPYSNAIGRIKSESSRLAGLTVDNPVQHARLESFNATVGSLLASAGAVVEARRTQGAAPAQTLLAADTTKQQHAQVLAQLDSAQEFERDLFQARGAEERAALDRFKRIVIALLTLMAIMYGFQYVSIRRWQRASQAWRNSEERFNLMANNIIEYGIFMLDTAGLVATWNPGAERIKGFRAHEILGRHFSRFYTPEDIAAGKPAWELETAAAKGHVRDQGWRLRKDGSRFWADVVITALRDESGTVRGYAKLTRDLTEDRQAEQHLRDEIARRERVEAELQTLNESLSERVTQATSQSQTAQDDLRREAGERTLAQCKLQHTETRLYSILNSAMDAIITVDETEHIVLFNDAATAIFGCPQSEALGAPISWFIPQRFRADHSRHLKQFGATGAGSRRMGGERIVMAVRRNGEEFPIEASISKVATDAGKLYTVILRDVGERVRAAAELQQMRDELRELSAVSASAREDEKRDMSRELHDGLAQELAILRFDIVQMQQGLTLDQETLRAGLSAMQFRIDDAIAETRRLAANLRPLILDDLGLVAATEWLVESFANRTGIKCELAIEPQDLELQDPHRITVFRILQESLTNVAKHSHANWVEVKLQVAPGEIRLNVHDNGHGFNADGSRKSDSFGLAGLRERAHLLDGEVQIDSAPGEGTRISVRIPLFGCESAKTLESPGTETTKRERDDHIMRGPTGPTL